MEMNFFTHGLEKQNWSRGRGGVAIQLSKKALRREQEQGKMTYVDTESWTILLG
jgi:hypothetical protein